MAVRPVVRYPHRVLKRPAEPLGRVSPATESLLRDLVDTMRGAPATVGLAAPQIGESVRALVLDVTGHPRATDGHGLVALVDPVVLEASGSDVLREGCLSVPELTANVRRASTLRVRGLGPNGRPSEYEMQGFEARVLLHEVDHLDGVLILDRVPSASDLFVRKVYR